MLDAIRSSQAGRISPREQPIKLKMRLDEVISHAYKDKKRKVSRTYKDCHVVVYSVIEMFILRWMEANKSRHKTYANWGVMNGQKNFQSANILFRSHSKRSKTEKKCVNNSNVIAHSGTESESGELDRQESLNSTTRLLPGCYSK